MSAKLNLGAGRFPLPYERDKEQNYGLPAEYIEAVRRAGGIPVLLPHGESYQVELLQLLDGIIFTGGGDVDPTHYEGTAHEALEDVDPERDASEIKLAQLIVDVPGIVLDVDEHVDIVAVTQVRRHPAGRGMGMGQKPHFLQFSHDVPEGRGAHAEIVSFDQHIGTDRHAAGNIAVYNSLKYPSISIIQVHR